MQSAITTYTIFFSFLAVMEVFPVVETLPQPQSRTRTVNGVEVFKAEVWLYFLCLLLTIKLNISSMDDNWASFQAFGSDLSSGICFLLVSLHCL